MFGRRLAGAALLAMVAAACGGSGGSESDASPLSITEYVDAINADLTEVDDDASRIAELNLPVDGELGRASTLFLALDNSLERLRAISPPPEVAAQHKALVHAVAEVQDTVLAYLQKASLEGDFEFADLGADPGISVKLEVLNEVCMDLRDTLRGLGTEGFSATACG